MSQESGTLAGLRVLFFGMGGVFSRLPLEALLRAGVDLRAVVEPAPEELRAGGNEPFIRLEPPARGMVRRGLPLAGAGLTGAARSLRDIGAAVGAPLYSVRRLSDPRTLAALAAREPDAICVACFTRRLPLALLALPRLGALNAHPSLLPDNRGPDPLFWTFHAGAGATGVTIHRMDAGLDTGPILTRRRVALAEGESEAPLEARLAALAGELMARALAGLAAGTLTPRPQNEALATQHGWPEVADYAIPAAWGARRAYIFARGVIGRGVPITLIARDGARFRLIEPLGYEAAAPSPEPWRLEGGRLALACDGGVFTCRATRLD